MPTGQSCGSGQWRRTLAGPTRQGGDRVRRRPLLVRVQRWRLTRRSAPSARIPTHRCSIGQPRSSPPTQSIGAKTIRETGSSDRLPSVVHSVQALRIFTNDELTCSGREGHHRERVILESGGDKACAVGHEHVCRHPSTDSASFRTEFSGLSPMRARRRSREWPPPGHRAP